jgi:hypothetical protein
MAHPKGFRSSLFAFATAVSLSATTAMAEPPAFDRSEERTPCRAYDALRQPLFGDLHLHTRYSVDSYISGRRSNPWDAYAYAKGEAISLRDENADSTPSAQIERPLDFAAVTDHASTLGQIHVCTEDSSEFGYWWPHCIMTRARDSRVRRLAADWWLTLAGNRAEQEEQRSFACSLSDCEAGAAEFWNNTRKAAEEHYDRSEDCTFTTFVAYEYSDSSADEGRHRAAIFRNEHVIDPTIESSDGKARSSADTWQRLRAQCVDGGEGCDVLSIPNRSNIADEGVIPDPIADREQAPRLFVERSAVGGPADHTVVWAEENSRDAIFSGIRRRETYATSGTRPIIRFFGGWHYPADLCDSPDLVARGYADGVPMGGQMEARPSGSGGPPTFVVSALKDPGSVSRPGTDLQLIQVVKGWVAADGTAHEAVYDVAGDPDNGADVNRDTCEPTGTGFSDLCTVWRDALYDPTQSAYYYLRVIENPTCHPRAAQCRAAGFDPFSEGCRIESLEATSTLRTSGAGVRHGEDCCFDLEPGSLESPVVQERAWTAPILHEP